MIVGVPREIEDNEYRVAATSAGVRELGVGRAPGPGGGRGGEGILDAG
jgi:hypothetical protein